MVVAGLMLPMLVSQPAPARPASGWAQVKAGKLYFDRRIWDDQVGALAARYRVIRYDVRGFGKSPVARKPHSNVDDLYRLLTFLRIDRATLVGVSLGGKIALDFALAHPDMVSALVLAAPGASGYGLSDALAARVKAVASAAQTEGAKRAAQLWLDDPLFVQVRRQKALHKKLLAIATANAESWKVSQPDGQPVAINRLTKVRAPTLIVVGAQDLPEVRHLAAKLAYDIPGAQKVVVPDADHALNVGKPEQFNRIVLGFLNTYTPIQP
jgi:pimeloyl-ACP methyl ester carboxylesterase